MFITLTPCVGRPIWEIPPARVWLPQPPPSTRDLLSDAAVDERIDLALAALAAGAARPRARRAAKLRP